MTLEMYIPSILALLTIASASVIPIARIDTSLIPEFGLQAGLDPNGSGSCVGANNILIPCFCPPDRNKFIERVMSAVANGDFLVMRII
jgi:hypothetical protein